MSFAREGYPFIGLAVILAASAWAGVATGTGGMWMSVVAALLSALSLFVLWFFRNPEPAVPTEPGVVVAPGQGKIIIVEEADEPTFLGGRARKISIFLSVFDVHVQRAPVSGVVEYRKYRPGAYAVAWADKASEINEQASLGIATPAGRVLVKQIAGLVARRIVTDPQEGQEVHLGRRIGLIRFGSRVDLFLPLDWEVITKVGDKVRVGSSILARHPVEVGS